MFSDSVWKTLKNNSMPIGSVVYLFHIPPKGSAFMLVAPINMIYKETDWSNKI